jgi:hypothetical protein
VRWVSAKKRERSWRMGAVTIRLMKIESAFAGLFLEDREEVSGYFIEEHDGGLQVCA